MLDQNVHPTSHASNRRTVEVRSKGIYMPPTYPWWEYKSQLETQSVNKKPNYWKPDLCFHISLLLVSPSIPLYMYIWLCPVFAHTYTNEKWNNVSWFVQLVKNSKYGYKRNIANIHYENLIILSQIVVDLFVYW